MKKIIALVLSILMLFLCGCQLDNQNKSDHNSTPSKTDGQDIITEESISKRLVREMDEALKKELEDPNNYSTTEMANVTLKYTEKWQKIADEYYNKLMEFDGIIQLNEHYYSSDDFHTFISEMKKNWEQYYQIECENYLKVLEAIYNGGTITITFMADYEYEMQKDWAVKLIDIYLMIDR